MGRPFGRNAPPELSRSRRFGTSLGACEVGIGQPSGSRCRADEKSWRTNIAKGLPRSNIRAAFVKGFLTAKAWAAREMVVGNSRKTRRLPRVGPSAELEAKPNEEGASSFRQRALLR